MAGESGGRRLRAEAEGPEAEEAGGVLASFPRGLGRRLEVCVPHCLSGFNITPSMW